MQRTRHQHARRNSQHRCKHGRQVQIFSRQQRERYTAANQRTNHRKHAQCLVERRRIYCA